MTALTKQDKTMVKDLNEDAESGQTKQYIDGMNDFVSDHGTDLPTVTDNDGSIVDKHAIIDMSRGYHDKMITKCRETVNQHPAIEYWFSTGYKLVPLSGAIMRNLLKDTVHFITTHYDRFDNEQNPDIHDQIGELKDEFK